MRTPVTQLGFLFAAFAAFNLASCSVSTVKVTTDYDHAAPFGTYKTYSIAPGADSRKLPPYCEKTLRSVVRSQLEKRGVAEASGPDADLAIVWHVFLTEQDSPRDIAPIDYNGEWPYGYGTYGIWIGAPRMYTNTGPYPDGTLVLDVVDMRTKKLVFRGTGTAVAIEPARSAPNIEKAVIKMVEALPAVHR